MMNTAKQRYWAGERFLESPYHRRYRIPERNGYPVQHQALNNLNQGTARDLMMHDLLRLEDDGLQPWLTIHDEILVECERADGQKVETRMRQVMSCDEHDVLRVPIRVDGGALGPAWKKT